MHSISFFCLLHTHTNRLALSFSFSWTHNHTLFIFLHLSTSLSIIPSLYHTEAHAHAEVFKVLLNCGPKNGNFFSVLNASTKFYTITPIFLCTLATLGLLLSLSPFIILSWFFCLSFARSRSLSLSLIFC